MMENIHPTSAKLANIIAGITMNDLDKVIRETIILKKAFLILPESKERYKLEKFSKLRDSVEFGMRMTLSSKELKDSMLNYSEKGIPTSLTKLSPGLSALAVYIFSYVIRGIQLQFFSQPGVVLRNLLLLGRFCVEIRDEIYLQIMKQLRGNRNAVECVRLWKILGVCLKHFPPSSLFENYLELFLLEAYLDGITFDLVNLQEQKDSEEAPFVGVSLLHADLRSSRLKSISYQCIYSLHVSIFKYGYDTQVVCPVETASVSYCTYFLSKLCLGDLTRRPKKSRKSITRALIENAASEENGNDNDELNRVESLISDIRAEEEDSGPDDEVLSEICEKTLVFPSRITTTAYDTLNLGEVSCSAGVDTFSTISHHRGSDSDWQRRFKLFSRGNQTVDCDEFVRIMCDIDPLTTDHTVDELKHTVDVKDQSILLLLVLGMFPKHPVGIIRDFVQELSTSYCSGKASFAFLADILASQRASVPLVGASNGFIASSMSKGTATQSVAKNMTFTKEIVCFMRRQMLSNLIFPPIMEVLRTDSAALKFWEKVIVPVYKFCDSIERGDIESLFVGFIDPNGSVEANIAKIVSESENKDAVGVDAAHSNGGQSVSEGKPNAKIEAKDVKISSDFFRDLVLAGVAWINCHEDFVASQTHL